MSYWDYNKGSIVTFKPEPIEGYPNWERMDCGCSGGLEWMTGLECSRCNSGIIYHHKPSGVLALYPGGPLAGKI